MNRSNLPRDRHGDVDRSDIADMVLAATDVGSAVVVHGGSGVGKSSLVLGALPASDAETQTVKVNLRHLPASTIEFESLLGGTLAVVLAELSAPRRLLVIDGADGVGEGRHEHLRYLIDAALAAQIGVIAITSDDNPAFRS